LLSSDKFIGRFQSLTGGTSTSHQRVRITDFENIKVAVPDKALVEKFTQITSPLFSLQHSLRILNKNTRKIRDLLLPRLVSGRIEV